MPIIKHDSGLSELIASTEVERVASNHEFTEGPVWHADGYLLYSDIPANRIWFWTDEGAKVFRTPSGNSNGLTFDASARLIACEHGTRRVSRTESDGAILAIAERFEGKRLNSPNDVVVRSDGSIFFTDPPYACPDDQRDLPVQGVFCLSPDGHLRLVATDFDKPNGLAFSRDESALYIDDSGRRHVRVCAVASDGTLGPGQLFAEMHSPTVGSPDGMKLDADGRLYVAGAEGVWVFQPTGRLLGILTTPEKPSNCCWGDRDSQSLFITARTSVYRVRTHVRGCCAPSLQRSTGV